MDERILAAIALSNRDYPSLDAKLEEAARWLALAAQQGAELVVLPEDLGRYYGDGEGNPNPMPFEQTVLDDWQAATAPLLDAAKRAQVAVAVPVMTHHEGVLRNIFYLVSPTGQVLGSYAKMYPTPEEIEAGVVPAGDQPLIDWRGLKVGGAICFDTCFPEVLASQARRGADLLLIPSLWPGGTGLNEIARTWSTPIILAYPAWSRIIDAAGRTVAEGGYRSETLRFGFGSPVVMATVNFDCVSLYGGLNERRIVDILEAYGDKVRINFDQPNCTFHLESRSANLTVQQVVEAFDLVPFRTYFEACRRRRQDALA